MRIKTRKGYIHPSIARGTQPRKEDAGGGATGADSSAAGNNGPVNQDSQTGEGEGNGGQPFNYEAFWAPREGSDTLAGGDSGGDGENAGKELGQQLVSQIQGFKASEIFTQESLQKMADGDLTGLNQGLQTALHGSMTQMLGVTAQLMKAFEGHFEQRFEKLMGERIEGSRTSDKDEQMLSQNFKGFSNPAVKPMIQGVFNQALQHSSGDRKKALELTRGMLKAMGQNAKDDFGFEGMGNPDNNLDEGPSRLVQELLALRR